MQFRWTTASQDVSAAIFFLNAAIFSTKWSPCAEEMDCARSEVPISRGSLTVVTLSNTAPT